MQHRSLQEVRRFLSMRLIRARILVHVLVWLVVLAIFVYVFAQLSDNVGTVREVLVHARVGFLAIHFLLIFVMFYLMIMACESILRASSHPIGLGATAFVWLTANLGKYVPGKVAMVVGRIELFHRFGMRRSFATVATAYEHLLSLGSTLPFLAMATLSGLRIESSRAIWVTGVVFLMTCSISFKPSILTWSVNLLLRLLHKEDVYFTLHPIHVFRILSLYLLSWVAYGFAGYILLVAFRLDQQIDILMVAAAFISAWFLGFISILTPGGLGIREAALVFFLAPSIGEASAIMVALVSRVIWTFVDLSGVVVGLLIGRRIKARLLDSDPGAKGSAD